MVALEFLFTFKPAFQLHVAGPTPQGRVFKTFTTRAEDSVPVDDLAGFTISNVTMTETSMESTFEHFATNFKTSMLVTVRIV
jgi:hypothetical protein